MRNENSQPKSKSGAKKPEGRPAESIVIGLWHDFYGLTWTVDLATSAHDAVCFVDDYWLSRLPQAKNRNRTNLHTYPVGIANTFAVVDYNLDHCLGLVAE